MARTRVAATEPALVAVEGSTPYHSWSGAVGGKRRAAGRLRQVALAHGQRSTQHTPTARPLLPTTCCMGAVLSIFCSSFPLRHTRHLWRPHQETAFPFLRHCRRYWRHGVPGAAHLDPRPTQPYCCGASDLSSFFLLHVWQYMLRSSCHWDLIIIVNLCKLPRRWTR